jgi:hypothetical protein
VTIARVSQATGEVLLQAVPSARTTHQAAELLFRQTNRGRLGQQAVELLRSVANGASPNPQHPVLIDCRYMRQKHAPQKL